MGREHNMGRWEISINIMSPYFAGRNRLGGTIYATRGRARNVTVKTSVYLSRPPFFNVEVSLPLCLSWHVICITCSKKKNISLLLHFLLDSIAATWNNEDRLNNYYPKHGKGITWKQWLYLLPFALAGIFWPRWKNHDRKKNMTGYLALITLPHINSVIYGMGSINWYVGHHLPTIQKLEIILQWSF